MDRVERRDLENHFSNSARRALVREKRVEVPEIVEEGGETRDTWSTPESKFSFTLDQARYLMAVEKGEDLGKVLNSLGKTEDWAERFLKRSAAKRYLAEKQRLQALSEVAGPAWTKVKAVEGVTGEWKPEKSQVECLKILKDINYPKQGTQINIQNNLLQMPPMSSEEEARLREFADQQADLGAA